MSTWVEQRINSDTVQNLYRDYVPAITNLYTVEIYSAGNMNQDKTLEANSYIKFHAPVVSIGSQSLALQRDEITKLFKLSDKNAFTRIDQLSITWREADDWRVRKYHEAWLGKFYNVEKDCFISYDNPESEGLVRKIKVIMPKTMASDTTSLSPTALQQDHALEFLVYPQNTGDIGLGWSASPSIVTHQLNYYVTSWKWYKAE